MRFKIVTVTRVDNPEFRFRQRQYRPSPFIPFSKIATYKGIPYAPPMNRGGTEIVITPTLRCFASLQHDSESYFHPSRYLGQQGMRGSSVSGYYSTLPNVIKTLPPIIRTAPSMIFLSILSEPFMKAKAKRSVKSGEVLAKGLATTTGNNFKAP